MRDQPCVASPLATVGFAHPEIHLPLGSFSWFPQPRLLEGLWQWCRIHAMTPLPGLSGSCFSPLGARFELGIMPFSASETPILPSPSAGHHWELLRFLVRVTA